MVSYVYHLFFRFGACLLQSFSLTVITCGRGIDHSIGHCKQHLEKNTKHKTRLIDKELGPVVQN